MSEPLIVGRGAFVVFVAVVLQTSLVASLPVSGARGDVVLLAVVCAAMAGGPARGALVGFCAGLTFDLLTTTPLGLSAFVGTVVGYAVGTFAASAMASIRWSATIGVLAGSAGGVVLFALTGQMVGQQTFSGPSLATIVVVVTAINIVLSPLALWAMRWAMASKTTEHRFSVR